MITLRRTIPMLPREQSTVFMKRRRYSNCIPKAGYRYQTESSRAVRILLYTHYRITYLIKPDGIHLDCGILYHSKNYLVTARTPRVLRPF